MILSLPTFGPLVERASHQDAGFIAFAKVGVHAELEYWRMTSRLYPTTLDLLEKMLALDPVERISLDEILLHPVFDMHRMYLKYNSYGILSSTGYGILFHK